jgi:hypothetical protein
MHVADLLLGFFRYYRCNRVRVLLRFAAADFRRSCVFEFSSWAVCVGNGKPCLKTQTPSVQGQRRDIVVQDPIIPMENTCRGISGDVLERLRVNMFVELLRAHEGYYNPSPSFDPAVVFSVNTLMQHGKLAHEFVEACRMTRMRSSAPPPQLPQPRIVQEVHRHQQQQQHQQEELLSPGGAAIDSSVPKQTPSNRWTEEESAFLWYAYPSPPSTTKQRCHVSIFHLILRFSTGQLYIVVAPGTTKRGLK